MNLKLGIILMTFSSVCACLGQLFWKLFTESNSIFILFCGFALYGLGALLMIIAYRFGPMSVLQPILSLNYVLTIILAAFVLRENITILKCVGVLFIIAGVFCIASGNKK